MTKYVIFILLAVIFLFGCTETKNILPPKPLTANDLSSLVLKAINGDRKANDSLSGLVDTKLQESETYTSISVDSFSVDTMRYFYVLVEYPNPLLNRLAFYDEKTNCYLIDKSLNGNLVIDVLPIQNTKLVKVVEHFIVKDTLEVNRLSLYRPVDSSIKLVYRSFAELKTPKHTLLQTITSLSDDTIKTQITVPKKIKIDSNEDLFFYDRSSNEYKSIFYIFDTLVRQTISDFEIEVKKPVLQ